jgi:hypothetical protein
MISSRNEGVVQAVNKITAISNTSQLKVIVPEIELLLGFKIIVSFPALVPVLCGPLVYTEIIADVLPCSFQGLQTMITLGGCTVETASYLYR